MAEDEDGFLNLSLPQKLQFGVFGAGTLIFLLTYLVSVLLNGTQYVNQWILDNPIPVLAYWSLQIGMLPVYRKTQPRQLKYLRQAFYNFISTGAVFILVAGYYYYIPPTTGIDRVVAGFSQVIAFASITGFFLSGSYFQFTSKNDD